MNIIKYNDQSLLMPTPLVEISKDHNFLNIKWGDTRNISLNGQLTGNYSQLLSQQNNLINIFSKNFGKFEIYEDNQKIFEESNIIVDDIVFDKSVYNGILNYKISLSSQKLTSGVKDPVNEFSFSEGENKIIQLKHIISAQGLNTGSSNSKSNGINNAINFVKNYTGLNNIPSCVFNNVQKFYLKSVVEKVNRLQESYSIEEEYVGDNSTLTQNFNQGILRYKSDLSEDIDGNSLRLNIDGTYEGALSGQNQDLLDQLNINSIIPSGFNLTPLSFKVDNNSTKNIASFSASYDDLSINNPYLSYTSRVNTSLDDQVSKISLEGEIVSRGSLRHKYNQAKSFLNSITNNQDIPTISTGTFRSIAHKALNDYKSFNGLPTDNNPSGIRLTDYRFSDDIINGKINFSINYDDKYIPKYSGVIDGDYSISIEAPIWYMSPNPTCDIKNRYIIGDFGIITLPKLNATATIDYGIANSTYIHPLGILGYLSGLMETQDEYPWDFIDNQIFANELRSSAGDLKRNNFSLKMISSAVNPAILPKL
jgi:hypothetical protein